MAMRCFRRSLNRLARRWTSRGNRALLTRSVLATLCVFALGACASGKPQAAPATTTTTTTTTPKQTLPPLNLETLPVPSHYTCPAGLYFLSPANQAAGFCVPHAYLGGGNTACPAGSFMTMGPVSCDNDIGIVTWVPPGPDTCSTPGGPCPSAKLPLSSRASVLPWSALTFPAGKCPAGYYSGETGGVATCVPYGYLPGGTSARPNHNTSCPAGSGLKVAKLIGTLCTRDAEPYNIVAPVPAPSS
jgi:hypothetical protein